MKIRYKLLHNGVIAPITFYMLAGWLTSWLVVDYKDRFVTVKINECKKTKSECMAKGG